MSFSVINNNVKLTRGDTLRCKISIQLDSGEYVPTAGDVVTFAMAKDINTPAILTIDVPTDTLILHVKPEDTKDLEYGTYVYDMQIKMANGDVYTFITTSKFTLTGEVAI